MKEKRKTYLQLCILIMTVSKTVFSKQKQLPWLVHLWLNHWVDQHRTWRTQHRTSFAVYRSPLDTSPLCWEQLPLCRPCSVVSPLNGWILSQPVTHSSHALCSVYMWVCCRPSPGGERTAVLCRTPQAVGWEDHSLSQPHILLQELALESAHRAHICSDQLWRWQSSPGC